MDQIPDEAAERVLGMIREAIELDGAGKAEEAALFFKPLVEEFPEASIVHSYMAWILSRGGKHREAIEHGRVAVRQSPVSEMSSILLFRVLWSAGERAQAFEEMKRLSAYGRSKEYERMMQDWNEGKPMDEAKDGDEG